MCLKQIFTDTTIVFTQAFESAWAAACKVQSSTMLIPSGYQFLVGPISFSGPYCQRNIIFQVITKTSVYVFFFSDFVGQRIAHYDLIQALMLRYHYLPQKPGVVSCCVRHDTSLRCFILNLKLVFFLQNRESDTWTPVSK